MLVYTSYNTYMLLSMHLRTSNYIYMPTTTTLGTHFPFFYKRFSIFVIFGTNSMVGISRNNVLNRVHFQFFGNFQKKMQKLTQ